MDIKSFYKTRLEGAILSMEAMKNAHTENWNKDRAEILEKSLEKLRKVEEDFDNSEKFNPEGLSEQLIKTIVSYKYFYVEDKENNRAMALPENTKIVGLWLYDYEIPNIGIDMEVPDGEGIKKITIEVTKLMAKYNVLDEGTNKEYFLPFAYAVFFEEVYNNTY